MSANNPEKRLKQSNILIYKGMSWEATYLPATFGKDLSKGGFSTQKEAWDYASKHFCSDCKREYNMNKGTPCDAEWMVEKEVWPPEIAFIY